MSVLATVLGLLLLNVLAFTGELVAYGTWYADGQPAGLYANAPGERPRLKPGARLDGLLYSIHVNDLGFRGPPLQDPPPANALRIWCLGGSTTFDIYAPDDDQTWPAIMGARLQAARPDRTVEVINAGIPGEILYGSGEDLQALGGRVRPDVVVIYHGPNDLRQVLTVPEEPTPLFPIPIDPALLRVASRVLQGSSHLKVNMPARAVTLRDLQPIRQRLTDLIRRAEGAGARPILATHAMRWSPDAIGEQARALVAESVVLLQMDAPSVIAAFATYNELIRQLAAERRIPLADVRAAVSDDPRNWGDATHFRAPGSQLAGAAVSDAILAAGLAD
ncbi:MAG: lysophospholipase L1-like esterase [Myxococcota bacterium]|jgi:lysophospholipase L1-like esterase